MQNIAYVGFFSWVGLHLSVLRASILMLATKFNTERVLLCFYFIMIIFSCKGHRVLIFVHVFQRKTGISKKLLKSSVLKFDILIHVIM